MDANQNPPSERDWTIEEQEEFFKSQDAITGLPSGSLAGSWASNAAISNEVPTLASLQESLAKFDAKFSRPNIAVPFGIHVTKIIPPEQGWPMAFYCPLCKETVFLLSFYAEKPKDGDYFKMNDTCADEFHGFEHNMRLATREWGKNVL